MNTPNVLITGAGSGIGRATAFRFAEAGWNICGNDLNKAALQETMNQLPAGNHHSFAGSFADEEILTDGLNLLTAEWGRLDALVSCAGLFRKTDPLLNTLTEWRSVMDVMLNGAFLISQKVVPLMKTGGRIVHITSIHGNRAEKFSSSYSVAKAAVNQLCRALALELAPRHILVNAIAPGFVDTAMSVTDDVNELESDWFRYHYVDGHHLPLRRAAQAGEIAGVALFLAGKDASYITGQVITVDGGLTITF